jgi:hypothetical protein
MSSLDEKLERPGPVVAGRARATLRQLENRRVTYAELRVSTEGTEYQLVSMGKLERWVRISGAGASAVFEQVLEGDHREHSVPTD